MKLVVKITIIFILIIGVLAVIRWHSPFVTGNYPTCPLKYLTGFLCPGCGTVRSLSAMLNLDFKRAFWLNPLMILSLPVLLWLIVLQIQRKMVPRYFTYTLLVIIIFYWIARNLIPFTTAT